MKEARWCISRGRAQRQSGFARLASHMLASLPASQRSDRALTWTSSPGCKCVIHVDGRREQNRLGFERSSWEAQSRNRPARRGAFFDVGSSVRWKRGLDVGTDVGTEYMDQAAAALHNMAQTPLNR